MANMMYRCDPVTIIVFIATFGWAAEENKRNEGISYICTVPVDLLKDF